MGNLAERADRGSGQGIMPVSGVDLADVDLFQPIPEALQHQGSLTHGRIDLSGMPEIEAKRGVGEDREHRFEFSHGPGDGLPLIHIFDTEPFTEPLPGCRVSHGVGM
jgi:hypothetical protein